MIYENNEQIPQYFYLIRTTFDIPFVVLKMAFLGGVSGEARNKVD